MSQLHIDANMFSFSSHEINHAISPIRFFTIFLTNHTENGIFMKNQNYRLAYIFNEFLIRFFKSFTRTKIDSDFLAFILSYQTALLKDSPKVHFFENQFYTDLTNFFLQGNNIRPCALAKIEKKAKLTRFLFISSLSMPTHVIEYNQNISYYNIKNKMFPLSIQNIMLNKSHKSNEILAFIPFGHKAQKMILSESSLIAANFDTETFKTIFCLSNLDELALFYNLSFYDKAFKAIDNILRNSNLSFIVISHSTLIFYSKDPFMQIKLEMQAHLLSQIKITNFIILGSSKAFMAQFCSTGSLYGTTNILSTLQNPCSTQLDHLANKQNAERFAATVLPLQSVNRLDLEIFEIEIAFALFFHSKINTFFKLILLEEQNDDLTFLFSHITIPAQFQTFSRILNLQKPCQIHFYDKVKMLKSSQHLDTILLSPHFSFQLNPNFYQYEVARVGNIKDLLKYFQMTQSNLANASLTELLTQQPDNSTPLFIICKETDRIVGQFSKSGNLLKFALPYVLKLLNH